MHSAARGARGANGSRVLMSPWLPPDELPSYHFCFPRPPTHLLCHQLWWDELRFEGRQLSHQAPRLLLQRRHVLGEGGVGAAQGI